MSRVARYAAPTPVPSAPSAHACGVNWGSCPIVRWNAHPATIETVNCIVFTSTTVTYSDGGYHR